MFPEQAALDRKRHARRVFGRLAAVLEQKRPVDFLDMDTPILNGFDGAGDLQEFLHCGFRVGVRSRLGKLHQWIPCFGRRRCARGDRSFRLAYDYRI
jgi:hypothetical protein